MSFLSRTATCAFALMLAACAAPPQPKLAVAPVFESASESASRPVRLSATGSEVALYAMAMIDIDYRFGGKKPEAGLDCSGMVSYIFDQAADLHMQGSASDIARQGQEIEHHKLRPGDLVFFNTLNRPFSHVGIYIGERRFVHAPSTNGKVRIDSLDNRYYAQRYHMARTYFN